MNQGDFDSLRGSCTAPSNKHVCFTGSRYNYVCKVWGIHNCMLHHTQRLTAGMSGPEEVRHASRNAESACPFLYWRDGKKGHAESAFRDACRTSSVSGLVWHCRPFTQNARESNHSNPIPATPIGAAVCGLVNIIMTLSVCI